MKIKKLNLKNISLPIKKIGTVPCESYIYPLTLLYGGYPFT